MHRQKLLYPNYQALFRYLQQYHSVPGPMTESLALCLETISYHSREFLLRPQQIGDRSWFLWQGIVRWFTRREEKETTIWLTMPEHIILLPEFLTHTVNTAIYLQAIEPCETLSLRYSDLLKLHEAHPEAQNITTKIVAHHNKELQSYALAMRMPKAEDRMKWLKEHIGAELYRIEASTLASFVNMGESTFYRIRKELENK